MPHVSQFDKHAKCKEKMQSYRGVIFMILFLSKRHGNGIIDTSARMAPKGPTIAEEMERILKIDIDD